jgi:NitT/TauT family transport system permease protein
MREPDRGDALAAGAGLLDRSIPIAGFIILIGAWEAAVRGLQIPDFVAPAPSAIARALFLGFRSGIYLEHLWVTAGECVLALLLAIAGGISLGSMVAQFRIVERAVYPLIIALQAVPKIALAPIIIVLFGYGFASKVIVGAAIAGFPVLVSQIAGLKSSDRGRIDVLKALSASEWQIFRYARFPGALPHLFAGIQVATVLVVVGVITGEFIGAKRGLGSLILTFNADLDTPQIFAILVVLSALGLGLYAAVGMVQRRAMRWSNTGGGA